MRFGITKAKLIASIVIPLVIECFVYLFSPSIKSPPQIVASFFSLHDLNNIFSSGNLFLFAIEIVIVYIIISLFQARYKRRN